MLLVTGYPHIIVVFTSEIPRRLIVSDIFTFNSFISSFIISRTSPPLLPWHVGRKWLLVTA